MVQLFWVGAIVGAGGVNVGATTVDGGDEVSGIHDRFLLLLWWCNIGG